MSKRGPVWAAAPAAAATTSTDATTSDRTVRILLPLPPFASVDRGVLGVPLPVVRADLHRGGGELRLEPFLETVLALPLGQEPGEFRPQLVEGQPRNVLAALEAGDDPGAAGGERPAGRTRGKPCPPGRGPPPGGGPPRGGGPRGPPARARGRRPPG